MEPQYPNVLPTFLITQARKEMTLCCVDNYLTENTLTNMIKHPFPFTQNKIYTTRF